MQDALSTTFAALADPTRRAILSRLALGETSVKELAEPFELSQPAISKHLKVLERAGLIARSRAAQSRPARLQPDALRSAAEYFEFYRQFWEDSFDRLAVYLRELQAEAAAAQTTEAPAAPATGKATARAAHKRAARTRDTHAAQRKDKK